MEKKRLEELNEQLADIESKAHNLREQVLKCIRTKEAIQDETNTQELAILTTQEDQLEEEIEERMERFP